MRWSKFKVFKQLGLKGIIRAKYGIKVQLIRIT